VLVLGRGVRLGMALGHSRLTPTVPNVASLR